MPAFLTLASVAAATPSGKTLFSDLSLSFGAERTGLVGRNGAGKSTLLRMIAGELAPSAGTITRSGTTAMLRQALLADEVKVAEALDIAPALARLDRIEQGAADEPDFDLADWTLPARIDEAFAQAGLSSVALDRPLASFSGGERTRIGVARLLIDPPDLLLLDEPTNNLDAEGRAAIAELLAGWRGGAIVASHDRALLEHMDRIVALSPTGVTVHGGGWSAYVEARDAARAAAEGELDRAERQVRSQAREAQVARERQARRDKAGRSYAGSGSAPKILLGRQKERAENTAARGAALAGQRDAESQAALDAAKARVEVVTPLTIDLPSSGLPANRVLVDCDRVSWDVGGRRVIDGLSFTITGPERIAVTGRNGAGKSSLLRLLCGANAASEGAVKSASERMVLLDQQVALLDRNTSIINNMRRLNPTLTDNQARAALARFAFRNLDAEKPVSVLSGGEMLRAGMACVLSTAPVPQMLLLDEPTNHLDIESLEVIEAALRGYDGAILAVSHDPAFLGAIGVTREIAL
ncbi:ATP-binding cassette domain-containing protein [Novosphingobium sp. JCM 18896]|uniref:ATP-binding cassette domain-containing protein n=1 Tax=Novosphingobium sp. JCM 18896 TaxID=2989731 RepID=UPI00222155CE|nr:ATP-binding cassette domain-containing protein [Novosphingobium sp. JCM 18896]MCW1428896.1 ATP-binding cassette domain-containing protein [Novosphingobium sp. JCM 18896]